MRRIDTSDREIDGNGPGKDGFTDGDPGVTPPTTVDSDWLNALQEEMARLVERTGAALNPADNTQLSRAVFSSGAAFSVAITAGDPDMVFTVLHETISGDFDPQASDKHIVCVGQPGMYLASLHLLLHSTTGPADSVFARIGVSSSATDQLFQFRAIDDDAGSAGDMIVTGSCVLYVPSGGFVFGDLQFSGGNVYTHGSPAANNHYNHFHLARIGPVGPV